MSDSYASAVWVLDALFQMARVGVDGVNIHSYRGQATSCFGSASPADSGRDSWRPGTFELLRAPSRRATNGVTLGGQSFGNETRSGRLAGGRNAATIAPVDGVYVVRLPAASAGLLTFAAPRR